jgi:1-acyl-sn-glycerol-3-phosphate acyltransferase
VAVALWLAAEASSSGDLAALYAGLSAVAVALIGAFVALRKLPPEPPVVRYVDPPTSNALPQALSELYEDAVQEKERLRIERDLWRARAVASGWTEDRV